jgi:hypothetical protein
VSLGHAATTSAQTLLWDEPDQTGVAGYAVTVDGVRTDYGVKPLSSNGTCACAIPFPFASGTHTVVVAAYGPDGTEAATTAVIDVPGLGASTPTPTSLAAPWTSLDIGPVGAAGSASTLNGVFTVNGSGADIWGTADAFNFVYQPISGDGTIVARVTGEQHPDDYAKAGVMWREALTPGSAHVILDVRPDGTIEFMSRSTAGGATSFIAGVTQTFPVWLKLSRSGTTVTGYVSSDGSAWSRIGTAGVSPTTSWFAGLAVTSHVTGTVNTSTFDNVVVAAAPATATSATATPNEVVVYASDIASANRHGTWTMASDATSPGGLKLTTPDRGVVNADTPLANPSSYVDVPFSAVANVPYRVWVRIKAGQDSKYNDSVWLQFSDATAGGTGIYRIGSGTGLLVNLATSAGAKSLRGWGWQNGAYWLTQQTAVTFPVSGTHTLRIQVREDGADLDQIVLSPATFLNAPPGAVSGDATIVPKP